MGNPIADGLVSAGWKIEAPRAGGDWRVVRARPDGSRLVVEQRGASLWLVMDEPGDWRVLGIEPTAAPAEVVAGILGVQDTASVADYFGAYGELGAVGDVSIIAWEQFDPGWC